VGDRWDRDATGTAESQLRDLTAEDAEDLGRLLWSGFGFHGVDGFASEVAAREEARAALSGKWGPMIWGASVLAVVERTAVAVSVVMKDDAYDFEPLLGFLVTDHAYQCRGIGESVLAATLYRMDLMELTELHLAVAPGNPACGLYRRMGFVDEPRGPRTSA
jgi:GNAT superfamily N-acetyltransferase